MKKSVALILLLFTVKVSAWGQGSCDITADQSPAIRGFRLGMTLDQLYELVPEARNDMNIIKALDQNKRQQLPSKLFIGFSGSQFPYNSIPRFQNITGIVLRFFNDQLTDLSVQYAGPSWNSANEFIAKLRESFVLPAAEDWKGNNVDKEIRCKDFVLQVRAQNNSGGYMSITDTTSVKKMDDAIKASLEKARKEFKP